MSMMGSKSGKSLVADINVTPLVDVMLVLLIIFMVAAPMMSQSDDIHLPETSADELRQNDEPMTIFFSKDGGIRLKDTDSISLPILVQTLEKKFPEEDDRKNQIIYLSADKDAPYGDIYDLFQELMRLGFTKVGMVTKPTDNTADKRE